MSRFIPVISIASLLLASPALAQITSKSSGPTGPRLSCSQPVPALELGNIAKPTKEKAEKWCACIWETMAQADRDFAAEIKNGTADQSNTIRMDRFSNSFGGALENCAK